MDCLVETMVMVEAIIAGILNWASTPSHSDDHNPQWDYGTVWNDAYNFLMSVNDNSLAQLGWYTLMINLHETGWHTSGEVADWEHRYSSHIKNANVYTEASTMG